MSAAEAPLDPVRDLLRSDTLYDGPLHVLLARVEELARACSGAREAHVEVRDAPVATLGSVGDRIEVVVRDRVVLRADGASPSAEPMLHDLARIAALAVELDERRRVETRLRGNRSALMELALSPALAAGHLERALQEITEAASEHLGVERAGIWVFNADQTSIQCLEMYVRAQRAHEAGVELLARTYPTYFHAMYEERTIAARDAHTDPRTVEFSTGYLRPLGIGAMLDAPIRVGGRMIGVLCAEHVGGARAWTADEEQLAGSLADFIALAIESQRRQATEEQLRLTLPALERRR